jgi:predicted dehydrogenase
LLAQNQGESQVKRRIGLIGLGLGAPAHARSLIDLSERVDAVAASRTQARCDAFAAQYPLATSTDIDGLIEDPSVSALILVTPPASHLELVRRAAGAGKHILLEKPLATTTADAKALVAVARDAGIRLGVVLQFRFREASLHLRRLIDDGALGEVCMATVSVPWWREQSYYDDAGRGTYARDGGGVLITQAIHTIDLFQSLIGGIAEVMAVTTRTRVHDMEAEDFVAAGLVLANGAPGCLLATTALYPGFGDRIEIAGTLGTAVLVGETLDIHYRDGSHERVGEKGDTGGVGADTADMPHEPHRALIVDFLDAIDADREPTVTGEGTLMVHGIIDALLASGRQGRRIKI